MFVDLFQRRTSDDSFFPEIDGLRFIAIFFVMTSHVWGNWENHSPIAYPQDDWGFIEFLFVRLFLQGKLGVLLFFGLSGFILALPWFLHKAGKGKPISLKKFYIRRLTRLEPPYLILMTIYFIGLCSIGRLDYVEHLPNLLASLTYTHNIIYGEASVIYMAAWSLEIEFQFYMIAPLLFGFICSLSAVTRRTLLVLGVIFFAAMPSQITGPETLVNYLHCFLVGVLIADLAVDHNLMNPEKSRQSFDFVALLGFVLLLVTFEKLDNSWTAQIGYSIAIFMLITAAFLSHYFRKFLRIPLFYLIGGMCYTIYLLHSRVLTTAYHFLLSELPLTGNFPVDFILLMILTTPFALIVCGVYYLIVEKPAMNPHWPAQLWARLRGKNKG